MDPADAQPPTEFECSACVKGDNVCPGCRQPCCDKHFVFGVQRRRTQEPRDGYETYHDIVGFHQALPHPAFPRIPIYGPQQVRPVTIWEDHDVLDAGTRAGTRELPFPQNPAWDSDDDDAFWDEFECRAAADAWERTSNRCVRCFEQAGVQAVQQERADAERRQQEQRAQAERLQQERAQAERRERAEQAFQADVGRLKGRLSAVPASRLPVQPRPRPVLTFLTTALLVAPVACAVMQDRRIGDLPDLTAAALIAGAAAVLLTVLRAAYCVSRRSWYRDQVDGHDRRRRERERLQAELAALHARGPVPEPDEPGFDDLVAGLSPGLAGRRLRADDRPDRPVT